MFEKQSKPRSGEETDREAVERIVSAFGALSRSDAAHLTGKQIQKLMYDAKATIVALEVQYMIRIRQSHE
jgi:hypothetical protein